MMTTRQTSVEDATPRSQGSCQPWIYVYLPLYFILPSLPFTLRMGLAAGRYLCLDEYL